MANDAGGGGGGGGGAASASPGALRRYGDAAELVDEALTEAAGRLGSDQEAWAGSAPEFGSGVGSGLASSVTDLAGDTGYTTGWVRLVADRFEAAGSIAPGGVVTVADDARFSSLIPPATEDEAAAEGEAKARELQDFLDEHGLGQVDPLEDERPSGDEIDDLVASYPEMAALLEEVRANGVAPAYHDAFVDELGADGIRDTIAAIRRYGEGQFSLQSDEGSELAEADISQDLLRPFDEVVRAGLDAGGNRDVAEELLDIDGTNAFENHDLALLLAHGDGAPLFTARAAETLLRAENELIPMMGGGPFNRMYIDDPALMSDDLLAIRALDRSPEASYDFLTRTDGDGNYTDNADLLIHPPDEEYVELLDGYLPEGESALDEYHRRAGGALENGYSVFPENSGDPNDMFVANDAFEVAIHETGEGDVPDIIKRSLASVAVTTEKMEQIAIFGDDFSNGNIEGDPLWENVDDDAVRDFFQELGYDNEGNGSSLDILSAGIGAYGQSELERGIGQASERGEEFEYSQLEDEAGRVGSLYGNLGAGLREINSDELGAEERRDALLGGLKTGGRAVGGALITISPLTGGTSAVAGLTVAGLVEGAAAAGDRASEPGEISIDDYKEGVRAELSATVRGLIESNPEALALLEEEGGDLGGPLATIFNNVDDQLIKKLNEAGE